MARARAGRAASAPLETYRRKRDFARTPEPSGADAPLKKGGHGYLIQKHAARRLHYDLRLELDGVLKSWAVTRGPSLDPDDKRLAVHVEDHPLEYGTFEGVIPKGQYGGGSVMLWDRGIWEPLGDDPAGDYAAGKLRFRLHGERLGGEWTLARMGGRATRERGDNWLLIKRRDDLARPGKGDSLLEEANTSVASSRTMEEIAADRDRVWSSQGEVAPEETAEAKPAKRRRRAKVAGAKPASLPAFVAPQLATLVAQAPAGDGWIHEIKLDGYRMLCRIEDGKARFLTRNGKDWTGRFPALAAAASALPLEAALIDGEIVVLRDNGVTDFKALQEALASGRDRDLVYSVFDLLHLNGADLTGAGLTDRKQALAALVPEDGPIQYSDHLEGRGQAFFEKACAIALEGVISKRRDAPYRPGRGRDWVKSKCIERQEFVIGGFTRPSAGARGIGALLLGVFEDDALRFAGKVGTGFTERDGQALRSRLERLARKTVPFDEVPAAQRKGVTWTRPELVCEVEFLAWTPAGVLRHPSFKGLREDKPAETIVRERPAGAPAAASAGRDHAGVKLSHPDRVLYPEQGLTKQGLADYYEMAAAWILPHIAGRPLSLVRCPSGHGKQCFYQRHAGQGLPDSVRPVKLPGEKQPYLMIEDLAGLVGLVQLGALELHPWGVRADDVERPDRVIFDLDPDEGLGFERVVAAAREVRERLAGMGLESFVKTTGGKGLHVTLPLVRRAGWPEVKGFAKALAEAMVRDAPNHFTATMAKRARKGRIFVDYLRNDRTATAVAPYSTRARAGAPVATPLAWDELEPALDPTRFTVATLPRRLTGPARDPWAEMPKLRQSITAKARRALKL